MIKQLLISEYSNTTVLTQYYRSSKYSTLCIVF